MQLAHNGEMTMHKLTAQLFEQLDNPFTAETLFDGLHDTVYFIKNLDGQYVVVNATLVERCGLKRKTEVLGRTSDQLLRSPFGERFAEQDRVVLQSGKPLVGQLELHLYASRDLGWCLTNKHPLRGKDGRNVGLVGFSRDLGKPNESTEDFERVGKVVKLATKNLSSPVSVAQLAKIARLSRYQLDRRMRIVFGLNTGQWLLKLRIDLACERLRDTDDAIVDVALQVGYADQSAFTRQFRRATGLSPTQYRKVSR
jgi:AraC-like DNA-binding protein